MFLLEVRDTRNTTKMNYYLRYFTYIHTFSELSLFTNKINKVSYTECPQNGVQTTYYLIEDV
jgi:hypothetical protein